MKEVASHTERRMELALLRAAALFSACLIFSHISFLILTHYGLENSSVSKRELS